jgi:hypothetical protein
MAAAWCELDHGVRWDFRPDLRKDNRHRWIVVVNMWWIYIVVVVLMVLAVFGFMSLVGLRLAG